jgi:hypothetical protein
MTELLFDGMALTVEVGFSTTAGAGRVPLGSTLASINWTDITEHVREVSTSRGRSSELDTYSAGSCQVLLDNRTRLFDPENTAGPYYGNLTPLRPIRIRVTPAGGTIRSIFFGFIDQWPQAYSWPNESTVTVTATDAFKVLNEFKLPNYFVYTTTYDAAPDAWYPLRDFSGSFYVFEVAAWTATSAQWMSSAGGGAPSFCVPGPNLIFDYPATSSSFDGQRFIQAFDPLGRFDDFPLNVATRWSVEMWIQTTESTTGNYAIWNHGDIYWGGGLGMVVAGGNATIVGQFGNEGSTGTIVTKNAQVTVNDGRPHHIMMTFVADPSPINIEHHLYVDGIEATVSSSFSDSFRAGETFMTIGFPFAKSLTATNNFPNYFKGSIQEVNIYKKQLSEAEAISRYQAGSGKARTGERTDQRIAYLADLADWMTDGLDLNTGDTTVQGIQTTGKGLLDALKEVETAEQGRIFMSVDGKIRFIDRNAEAFGNFITSQATFSDNPGVGEIKYSDITLTYDDRYIFNEITVTQPNGTSYTESDSTSQGKYFKKTLNIDNFIADDAYYTANAAIYKLNRSKDPQMRIDQMSVNARRDAAYQSPCVTLDIGDRITVERTPQDVGAQITKSLIIEGIKHSITRDSWVVTFNTDPTLQNAPFVLDSATLGVLDTNILGY